MHIYLIVPGLSSPLHAWMRDYDWEPKADALARMLTGMRGHRVEKEHAILTAARLLGWKEEVGEAFPAAGLRALVHGFDVSHDSDWVCADPVHLRVDISNAVLLGGNRLNIDMSEAIELIDSLESMFSDDRWHFRIGSTNEWYIQTPPGTAPDGPILSEVIGKSFRDIPRKKTKDSERETRLTEIQMVLNEHPVNRARQARGELTINSLWYWGRSTGDMDLTLPGDVRIIGRDHILNGLANRAGVRCESDDPNELIKASQDDVLIYLDNLTEPAAYDDLQAWEKELAKMEANWFGYLEKLIDSGDVMSIDLLADGYQWRIAKKGLLLRFRSTKKLAHLLNNN